MSNSHGDLFTEIGKLVLAVNLGQAIDLDATAKDLAARYNNLGITEETFAKVVARSIGAVRLSLAGATPRPKILDQQPSAFAPLVPDEAIIAASAPAKPAAASVPASNGRRAAGRPKSKAAAQANAAEVGAASTKSPFPSGVRLAVLT